MREYEVLLYRQMEQSATINVSANTPEEATGFAIDMATDDVWYDDDCGTGINVASVSCISGEDDDE
jgi:hypothetical protein